MSDVYSRDTSVLTCTGRRLALSSTLLRLLQAPLAACLPPAEPGPIHCVMRYRRLLTSSVSMQSYLETSC